MSNDLSSFQHALIEAARVQDRYDLETVNLIAPASPTLPKYVDRLPLRHYPIIEGLLEHRPYAGAEGINRIERIAAQLACQLFRAEHANVQPHSVSQANQAVYQALLEIGDRVLAMRFDAGGHLTHGMERNFSGRFFRFDFYGVDAQGLVDYVELGRRAMAFRPKLIVCGASSYPRAFDFGAFAQIAQRVGAVLLADLSHPAGLIVADRFPQPFPFCDIVTLTFDKTMLGPHGGIILCKREFSDRIDRAVHPGVQSSFPVRRIYEMAQCMIDCNGAWFRDYIGRVLRNMNVFEDRFRVIPGLMISGGSDTHLMVLETAETFGLTGKEAEGILEETQILTNRQVVPGERRRPYIASGIRLGTSWITARGYTEAEVAIIAEIILKRLGAPRDSIVADAAARQIRQLLSIDRPNDVWREESKLQKEGTYA